MYVDPEYRTHQPADVLIHISHYPQGAMIFYCPGCKAIHRVNVAPTKESVVWGYNGDPVKPTLSPSVLQYADPGGHHPRCHSFVRNGQIQFLSDCGHELAGMVVSMIPYDEAGDTKQPSTIN